MSPDRSQRCKPLGRSLDLTATLAAVGAVAPEPPIGPQATTIISSASAESETRMRSTLRDELGTASHLKERSFGAERARNERPPQIECGSMQTASICPTTCR